MVESRVVRNGKELAMTWASRHRSSPLAMRSRQETMIPDRGVQTVLDTLHAAFGCLRAC
jgi:hypothetical protein